MELTVQQIFSLQGILKTTGQFNPDGSPVFRRLTGADLSALRWFDKNVEEIVKTYRKLLDDKRKKLEEEKYNQMKTERAQFVKSLSSKMASKECTDEELKESIKKLLAELSEKNIDRDLTNELNSDEELTTAFAKTLHKVEIREKTEVFIKNILKESEFTAMEAEVFVPLLEVFNVG
jgi:HD-GYP domain-containing protein (c-di-GMP phosphodiesterase class II)